jgi:heptosyltransferase-2
MGIEKRELLIGVHPGAAYGETKRWFPERFGAVLGRLQKSGRRFLLLGGPGEELIAQQISRVMERPPIDLVGKTTVAEALALVSQKTAPLNKRAVVIHPEQVSCTPCFKRSCPEDLECMKAITVQEVHAAAEKLLRD